MQEWNKNNNSTGDYRGSKVVLNERIIEGLNTFDLSTEDLQLSATSPRWCIIESFDSTHSSNKICLPDATTLKNGWTISIINQDTDVLEVALYTEIADYTVLRELSSNSMSQFLLLNNSTKSGVWKLITTGEYTSETEDKYTTSVFNTTTITNNSLGSGTYKQYQLSAIPATTAVRSIFFKPTEQFSGVDLYMNIGTYDDTDKFYSNIQINGAVSDSNYTKDLFEEILSTTNSKNVVASIYTGAGTGSTWYNVTHSGTTTYSNAVYGNNIFLAMTDDANVSYCSDTDDTTWSNNFDLSSVENYEIMTFDSKNMYYDSNTSKFYIFGKITSSGYLGYITFDGTNFQFVSTLISVDDAPIKTLLVDSYIKIIGDNYILSTADLSTGSFVKTSFTTIQDTIYDVQNGNNLYVISGANNYYTTSDFVTINTVANTNGYIFKYLNSQWIRFTNNSSSISSIAYSSDFITWTIKDISITNILDIYFIGNTYRLITDPSYNSNKIISSTDLFTTSTQQSSTFETNTIKTLTGNPANLVIVGETGDIAYTTGDDFYLLTSGSIDIIVECVKEINPVAIKNPIINTQLPIGTIFSYIFQDTPNGYMRLNGSIFPEARTAIPTFIELLESQTNSILVSENIYNNELTTYGSCGRFCWVNNGKDLKFPTINNFVRGYTISGLADLGASYIDTIRPITGKVENNIQGHRDWGATASGALQWTGSKGDASWEDNTTGYSGIILNSALLGANYNGSETTPKYTLYPYIISVYNSVQSDAGIDADNILQSVEDNRSILQQCYTLMASSTSGKNPVDRQCIVNILNQEQADSYISTSGLIATCLSGVIATSAQGFDSTNKSMPLDSQIITTSNITKTVNANETGVLYLLKQYVDGAFVISLETTTEWYEQNTEPSVSLSGAIWYDTFHQALYMWNGVQWNATSAVKLANYTSASAAIYLSNIQTMRNGGRKIGIPNFSRGVSKTYVTTYTAESDGFLNINLRGSYRNDFYLQISLDNGVTWITRAHYGDDYNGNTKWVTGEYFIPEGCLYKTFASGDAWEYITLTFYPCIGVY